MTRLAPALAAVALAVASVSCHTPAGGAPAVRTVVDGLEFPTAIAFDSAGNMYVNERPGRIRVVRGGELAPRPLAEIPTTVTGETGLLGLALSPDEDYLYAFVTDPSGETNEVVRLPVRGGRIETIVSGLPADVYHNGGGVAFDGDGMLLVSNGEQHSSARAQDPDVLGGKVYRFTSEGAVAPDGPFGDSAALAIGLRNPFGLAVDPVSGNAFVTENGPSAHDEVDRIVPGGNYGWPLVSGRAEGLAGETSDMPGAYQDPLLDYPDIVVPTGITFADLRTAPVSLRGDLFFATYGEEAIHRVRLSSERTAAASDEVFAHVDEPVVALAWGPRGLYFTTPTAVELIPLRRAPRSGQPPSPRRHLTNGGRGRAGGPEASSDASRGSGLLRALAAAVVVGGGLWLARSRAGRRARRSSRR
jgi:glucose/arabinose dehydrogenase